MLMKCCKMTRSLVKRNRNNAIRWPTEIGSLFWYMSWSSMISQAMIANLATNGQTPQDLMKEPEYDVI